MSHDTKERNLSTERPDGGLANSRERLLMELTQPFFRALDAALSGIVAPKPVELRGAWSTSLRKTYRSAAQEGTGTGPFVDVQDTRWSGALSCAESIGGMGFLVTPDRIVWSKGSTVELAIPAVVCLSAHAGYREDRATFVAGLDGTGLPGIPVATDGCPTEACVVGPSRFETGRVVTVARIDPVTFAVLVLPGSILKMGRNHLWRVRDGVASHLPSRIREVLTRRRGGSLSTNEP